MTTFNILGQRRIDAIQSTATLYRHAATGAHHLHLDGDDQELGFLVAFPTAPRVSDGRAHILEHVALCGSERFPVRDPFMAMLRRSVATFMNAMTYPDRTVYPFSTTDPRDFEHLLDVYLDATFFPQLDRLNFLQEGWRPALVDERYAVHGVVFNEMKNAYAQPGQALQLAVMRELLGGSAYETDFGGDPLVIPGLDYDTLRAFHAQHYHPSNAVFMTSGRLSVDAFQQRLQASVLSRFSGATVPPGPGLVPPWLAPRSAQVHVPAEPGLSASEHGLYLLWRQDGQASTLERLRLGLLAQVLMGHDGSPLMQTMHASGLGRPAQMCGAETSLLQTFLLVGLEGLTAEQLPQAEQLLMSTLQTLAAQPIDAAVPRAIVRQLRFEQRSHKSGWERLLALTHPALRGLDWLDAVDAEPDLARLEAECCRPDFLQTELRRLLDSPNRLRLHALPDEAYFADREAQEAALLAARDQALDPQARAAIQHDAEALAAFQALPAPGDDVLPRIRPAELARDPAPLLALQQPAVDLYLADVATHGLVHAELRVDVSALPPAHLPWLQLLVDLWPLLGTGARSVADTLAWRQAQVQDFSVMLMQRTALDGTPQTELALTASALAEQAAGVAEVLRSSWLDLSMADADWLAQRIRQSVQAQQAQLSAQADELARLEAVAPLSPQAARERLVGGLPYLAFQGQLLPSLASVEGVAGIQAALAELLAALHAAPRAVLALGAPADAGRVASKLLTALPEAAGALPALRLPGQALAEPLSSPALIVDTQVNSCVQAWRVPTLPSDDAAGLAVAAPLLTDLFLHPAVREQGGAYGVNASYDPLAGVFRIASMADPRLAGTFQDYTAGLQALLTADILPVALEEAIVSVVKRLDRPLAPAQRLAQSWAALQQGMSETQRQAFRHAVLGCSVERMRLAVQRHLAEQPASRAAAVGVSGLALDGLTAVPLATWAATQGIGEA